MLVNLQKFFLSLFSVYTYETELEAYISKHHPMDVSDIERLTIEYQRKKESFI
jgi:hypothetical protein